MWTLCLTESGVRTAADVKWPGLPICRDPIPAKPISSIAYVPAKAQ
jgi:hypothetical protein